MSIGGRSLSMTWRRDNRSLVLVDSMGYMPMSLERIGQLITMRKPVLPQEDDDTAQWYARCRRDVEIMRASYMQLLTWIERTDLGNWQRTGAGMAWANWRHHHYTHRVLVHATPEARTAEVAAIATGRCEAWRHGWITSGDYTEWDLPMAYPRIAQSVRVPCHLMAYRHAPRLSWLRDKPDTTVALVHATVTTEVPVLPLKTDDGWRWPVGTFTGWWWDRELLLVDQYGGSIKPHGAYVYKAYFALKKWAEWVIDVAEGTDDRYSPLQRAVVKHWSRALIGRFGAKYPLWKPLGEAPEEGAWLNDVFTSDSGATGKILTLGTKCWLGLESSYVADACPAIMGYIMAECRARLWQLTQACGPEHVAYMDTDSLITDRQGSRNLEVHIQATGGYGLRRKTKWHSLEILGPRQLILDGHGRIAGIPKAARPTGQREWAGQAWEGIGTALGRGADGTVRITDTTYHATGLDRRRQHLDGGATAPHTVEPVSQAG